LRRIATTTILVVGSEREPMPCMPDLTPTSLAAAVHGLWHAISSEGAKKLKLFLKNVAHHGWAMKKFLGPRKLSTL